ncbi:putative Intraflagellar transport complex B protein 46 C terminal [Trypanosoma vivax]|uniref:Intraflagellar transport complex B protein 46 C terminal n=1 Tax=Trypanosoma vivax (strain Y486) TaxID=1055687 RepID=G0TWY0_TRYVY|nr:hypothetical protein TRVL_03065 [Trypanosoma vivax]KAH8613598.1 putative Intraflagellar transport complex B protein 46 C terminal [Trypanosoma vivax]CCC48468.1 conserved hypothetical protein [Trypanosoma vivax Y486]
MPQKRSSESEDDESEELNTSEETGTETEEYNVSSHQPHGSKPSEDTLLVNNPNDEKHKVENARQVRTPSDRGSNSTRVQDQKKQSVPGGARLLRNNPNDEVVPVEDVHTVSTPRMSTTAGTDAGPKGTMLRNAPHDEAIPLAGQGITMETPKRQVSVRQSTLVHDDDNEKSTDDETPQSSRVRGYGNVRPEAIVLQTEVPATVMLNLEYKPQDYAIVNANASREMQELFKHILDYHPQIPELPAKLRPFIPDYIPAIGDLDPFCKVPRPDGKPDGLGVYVLDEPSVSQSNPAVVLLELRATNIHPSAALAEVVDSFEDAANRPEVIDRWIADVKKVHYKKPLPTINYQKPMPEIETLLQVWPTEFEEFLNSDIQMVPPTIDLDMDQYVRTLCAILDIPTYNSLIDSLHVMFTLYQEFRANQHFQHE